jgi:hypothetical protein
LASVSAFRTSLGPPECSGQSACRALSLDALRHVARHGDRAEHLAFDGERINVRCGPDIVAKVAAAPLWNSNLKQSNRDVRTFESMLRLRVKT